MSSRGMVALALGATLGTASPVRAQAPSSAALQVEAMKKVDRWVGSWKGTGWALSPAGERGELAIEETVVPKVGGTVLFAEGQGTARIGSGPEVTREGIAMLFYDERTERYRWHGHDVQWGSIDADAQLVEGGFQWSYRRDEHGPVVRFTITLDEARWHEVGEASADGTTWRTFMEWSLVRQAGPRQETARGSERRRTTC